jgi:Domain of unknown function (DUF4349)
MTSSPDLIQELRASRPSAPADLRARVRELAAERPARTRWTGWRFPARRGALIAVPAAVALAIAAAGVVGLSRSDAPDQASLAGRNPEAKATHLEAQTAPSTRAMTPAPTFGATDSTTGPRAQRVSATLTVEVRDSNALSRAAQDALDLTRSLGGYVVSSSVTTGEQGNASLTVRVPVARVQDAIAGLSGLGRIVSQQVTVDDLQEQLDQLDHRRASLVEQITRITARLETQDLDAEQTAALEARRRALRNELRTVRSQIAGTSAEGRMSTIQLSIVTPNASGAVVPGSRIDRTVDQALNVLAWEGVVALGMLIVLAPFALVGLAVWLGRRVYRRHEEERLLAT